MLSKYPIYLYFFSATKLFIRYFYFTLMSVRTFTFQLIMVTILVSVLLWLLTTFPVLKAHQELSWMSLALFVFISIIMFFSGRWGVGNENKSTFIGLMYAYMGGKMLLSVIMITLYYLYYEPDSKLFILPFFLVYFIYTIFESYFLMKLNDAG